AFLSILSRCFGRFLFNRVELLIDVVDLLSQLPVVLLQIEHLGTQIAPFVTRFFGGADGGNRLVGSVPLGRLFPCRREGFQNGEGLGIAQSAQSPNRGQLHRLFPVIQVAKQELADTVFVLLIPSEVGERVQAARQ